jgi:Dyp-type peroxidase family
MAVTLDLDDIQGIIARGYNGLRHARFTMFGAGDPAAGPALLSWLLPRITTAGKFSSDTAVHVAFTAAGLRRLGLPEQAADGFSLEFLGGMTAPNRSRFLGDAGPSDPGSWAWGAPGEPVVDGLILLYARSADLLNERHAELTHRLAEVGAGGVTVLDTLERLDREPFGFRDGISQPVVEGLPKAVRGQRAVAAGEFVLGYPNGYGQLTDRPLLPRSDDPGRMLPPDPGGSGAADLGRNGTYLVLRQLEQDVEGFWRYAGEATQRPDGSADPAARAALAAKLVGRWPSGAPLVKAPDRDDPSLGTDNDFGYYHTDPLGMACPLGAHIRRTNPRDSLDPQPGTSASLDVNALHRLIRRGRAYGPGAGDGAGPATGIYFICLAASLSRQFEFVQHTWLNNPTFNGLYDDADPLTGSRHGGGGTFTAPARPVRRRHHGLPQFVRTRGGAYFFLPGLSALRYLAQLPGPVPSGPRTE